LYGIEPSDGGSKWSLHFRKIEFVPSIAKRGRQEQHEEGREESHRNQPSSPESLPFHYPIIQSLDKSRFTGDPRNHDEGNEHWSILNIRLHGNLTFIPVLDKWERFSSRLWYYENDPTMIARVGSAPRKYRAQGLSGKPSMNPTPASLLITY
jgi:hypothetical protein